MIKIDFSPSEDQLRQFGWIALFGFSLMASLVLWRFTEWSANSVVYVLFGLAVVCPLFSLLAPVLNKPIYVAMMVIAMPIGFVISAVVLRIVYYGLFTPIAWWFKMRGRDSMHRRFEPEAATYWTDHRDKTKPRTPESYLRLY